MTPLCVMVPHAHGGYVCKSCGRRAGMEIKAKCKGERQPRKIGSFDSVTHKSRHNPLDCKHNVGILDYQATRLCGCKSVAEEPTMVAECALFGPVTPLARSTKEGLKSCQKCSKFAIYE